MAQELLTIQNTILQSSKVPKTFSKKFQIYVDTGLIYDDLDKKSNKFLFDELKRIWKEVTVV
jgi:hypothetical protein